MGGGGANLKNRDHCVDCPTHARAVKLKLFGTIFYDTQARSLVSKWGGGVRFNSGGAMFRSRKFASAEGASF